MPGIHLNDTERRLRERWNSTFGPSLRSIEITGEASLRGIRGVTVDLRYPLVVLAGKNGTGKSTFLACAACSYRNSGSFETFFFRKKYLNFNDLFAKSSVDSPFDNVSVQWTYRKHDGTVAMVTATKVSARWAGYRKRPERPVEFLGLMRVLHPTELKILRSYFGSNVPMTPLSLGESSKTFVSGVMARNYNDLQCATQGRYSLNVLSSNDSLYSGFNAGSGEDISCLISRVIDRLPERGLLIIEEIETGLHPAAQRQLISKLLECCFERKLQIICSSHSQAVLESVPVDARILLVRCGTTLQPRYGISVAEAISDMGGIPITETCIYVEDDVAKKIVVECLHADIRKRVRIVDCGNWDDVIRFLSVYRHDPDLGNAIGVLDGDRNSQDADHRRSLDKYMGGHASADDWAWLQERLHFLPGTVGPEMMFYQHGQEPAYREIVAAELNASTEKIKAFFSSFVTEPHWLPFELGQQVGLEETRILVGLAKASCLYKATEFRILEDFIRRRIDAAAR